MKGPALVLVGLIALIFALTALTASCQPTGSKTAPKSSGDRTTAAAPATAPAAGGGASPAGDPGRVVATVDGKDITAKELDDSVRGAIVKAETEHAQAIYGLRANGLDALIDSRLVKKAADAEKLSAEALYKREVDDKIAPPAESELRALYDGEVANGNQLPPFDVIKDRIAEYMKEQKTRMARDGFHARLRAAAKVETKLGPMLTPKVEVKASGPSKGPAAAPVTVVEFSDYECPFCARAEDMVKQVLAAYPDKVRLVFQQYPLPGHAHAKKASEAALCAGDQGKYWEMHDRLFKSQRELEVEKLKSYARELGVDGAKFDACLDGGQKGAEVTASLALGSELGVSGTPAFFINGRALSGAMPFEMVKGIIDHELAAR